MEFTDERLAVSLSPASGKTQLLPPVKRISLLLVEPILSNSRDSTVNPEKNKM